MITVKEYRGHIRNWEELCERLGIDLVALKYSIMVNGVTQLIMMKSDVLDGFETIKACVTYWEEITEIFDWARTHVTSTLYICWAAQAGLYHHYGVPKYPLDQKMFGIFEHRVLEPFHSIFRGFDDCFYVPHSRHTEVRREDILKVPELTLLSESKDAGVYMAMARGGREFFVTGHSEYSPYTLDTEYRRDLGKGLPIEIPRNYYVDDDPDKGPLVRWRAHANLLFSNWLNYFVYQETPYNINDIE